MQLSTTPIRVDVAKAQLDFEQKGKTISMMRFFKASVPL